MSRPLRISKPGLWHHVMNRGLGRRHVFTDLDYEVFLALLAECRDRWGIETHAFCLMSNHFHLLLKDPQGHLSRAMRHLTGVYTQRIHRRDGGDGPIFRGRFRSRLVQDGAYVLEAARYIHMNPVAAGLVRRAGDYRWSSHRD